MFPYVNTNKKFINVYTMVEENVMKCYLKMRKNGQTFINFSVIIEEIFWIFPMKMVKYSFISSPNFFVCPKCPKLLESH